MKKTFVIIMMITLALASFLGAEIKIAQSGAQFLSVSSDGYGSALAGSMTVRSAGSLGLIYNPATMALDNNALSLTASQNSWIADISHNTLTLSFKPAKGRYGVLGVSVVQVNYGDVEGTAVAANDQGYVDTGIFTPTAMALGVGYAKSLTDKFSVGGQVKLVGLNYGTSIVPNGTAFESKTNALSAYAFDFGTMYRTGFKSLDFGMSVRNFSQEIKFEDEGFQMPLTFTMGIGMNMLDLFMEEGPQKLNVTVDAVHYRSHEEQVNIGVEYALMNMFFARGGYSSANDENDITYGIGVAGGVAGRTVNFDYAKTPFGVFGDVQRITISVNI